MIAAVDVGFGRTKAISSYGDRFDFPSLVGKFKPVLFSPGIDSTSLVSRLAISLKKKDWYVGEAAAKQSAPQNTIDPERTVNEEGLILLIAALALLAKASPEVVQLIAGLPVSHYQKLKERYLSTIGSCHFADLLTPAGQVEKGRTIAIEQAKIIPQPMGTYFDIILNDEGALLDRSLADEKIGIVDIGYNTLDLARVDGLEIVNPRSVSYSGLGIFSAFQSLSAEIQRSLGVEVLPEKLESMVQSKEVVIAGRHVSIKELKQAALGEAAGQIVSRVKSAWPDRWELDRIVITGGGAILLGEYLLPEFEDQAVVAPAPEFSNVNGYLKFGKRIWRE